MVKIFSPMAGQDPLGQTIANLGRQMFGDKTANLYNQAKLYEQERQNAETDNLMKKVGAGGAQNLGSDPITQALLIGSGYKPGDFADIGLMGAATGFGAKDPRTGNWQVASGQSYDNTFDAFNTKASETARANNLASTDRRYGVDQSQATEKYKFDNTGVNVVVNGQPTIMPQGEVGKGGYTPVLPESEVKGTLLNNNWNNLPQLAPEQQQVLGADPTGQSRTPKNYIVDGVPYLTYDGVTDVHGRPLKPGGYIGTVTGGASEVDLTNSSQSQVQQGILANNKLSNLLATTREMAQRDPMNFGIPGFIKGMAQDARVIAQGLAGGLGFQAPEQMFEQAQKSILANPDLDPNLISGVFDPNLSSLHTLSDLMVYSAAEALAGQSGRSVSDRDVQFFKNIVGDPQAWMMSQEKYLAKLTQVERILQMNQAENEAARTGGAVDRTGAPQAAPAAPQAAPIDDLVNKYRSR